MAIGHDVPQGRFPPLPPASLAAPQWPAPPTSRDADVDHHRHPTEQASAYVNITPEFLPATLARLAERQLRENLLPLFRGERRPSGATDPLGSLVGVQLPQHIYVAAAAGESVAVRAKCDRGPAAISCGYTLPLVQWLSYAHGIAWVGNIPQPHCPVRTSTSQGVAVQAKRHRTDARPGSRLSD